MFAHKLLWKAYDKLGDKLAYNLMSNVDIDRRRFIQVEVGKRVGGAQKEWMSFLGKTFGPIQGKQNVESGQLDAIRHLANNEAQRKHASELANSRIESGELEKSRLKAVEAWTGSNHTEEFKKKRSEDYKIKYSDPLKLVDLMERQKLASIKRTENATQFSIDLIINAERNEEFLQESSSRSKNKFVSPEGLEFDSPIFAAKYYGNVEAYIIENWCKRNKYGWSRQPKAA